MRKFALGLLASVWVFASVTVLSTEAPAQDPRLIGGGPGITVFEDRNFRGETATYQNNVPSLPWRLNNRISSIRVGAGEQWQVCDQANYRGQCITISGEESNLARNNWDNRISSMRRISGGGGGGVFPPVGGGQISPPVWARGTFYGTAPSGGQITLTINPNGSVNVSVNGETSSGVFQRGNYLWVNGARSRVSRQGNGILTVRVDNGERISYSRTGWGGGWNPGGDVIRPPSWALGTFVGTAPNRDRVTLFIANNGQVTVNVGGNVTYGSFTRNNILVIDGQRSRVTSVNRGIRTVSIDTGETITYRRQ